MTTPEVSLGETVRQIPALVHLLDYIEANAASIFIRDQVNGRIGNYALIDLPAARALKWAFHLVRNSTIPISTGNEPDFQEDEEEGEEEEEETDGETDEG